VEKGDLFFSPRMTERDDNMSISDAQKRASRKYNEKAYDRIELKVIKGKKTELQAHAESKGESLNGFINRSIDETMERDNARKG